MKNDTRVRFTLRLPGELSSELKNIAKKQGVPLNSLILHVLDEWAEEQEKNKKNDEIAVP